VEIAFTSDNDQQLCTLTKRIREEVAGFGWQRLSTLLLKISQFNKAPELYIMLLDQTSDAEEKALYYNQHGYVKNNQDDYEKVIWYYEKGLEIEKNSSSKLAKFGYFLNQSRHQSQFTI
jgi:tetratricopeptide (TPR) repeat protein